MKRTIRLTFPPERIKEPMVFTMAREFYVMPNILRARISGDSGEMVLELEGEQKNIEEGLEWLRSKGIEITDADEDQ